jgi:hypothetical protein
MQDGENGPVIKHGYTMTTPIRFDSVIQEIKEFSQLNPDHYPIILSLENHCNEQNEQLMAASLKRIFADKLFLIPEMCSNIDKLPSPNQLLGRIIVQGTGFIENWRSNFRRDKITVSHLGNQLSRMNRF